MIFTIKYKPAKSKKDIERKKKELKKTKFLIFFFSFVFTISLFGGIVYDIYSHQRYEASLLNTASTIFFYGVHIFAFIAYVFLWKTIKKYDKLVFENEKSLGKIANV